MKKYISIVLLILLAISIDSCKTDDLELVNPNGIASNNFPTTKAELEAAVAAVYAPLQSFGLHGRVMPFLFDGLAGENAARPALQAELKDFIEYTMTPENPNLKELWQNTYAGINRANLVLDNEDKINNIQGLDQAIRDKYIGEAKFLRGYYYFLLVRTFGDVPLYSSVHPDLNNGEGYAKSTKEEIYQLVLSDLNDAAAKLRMKADEDAGRVTVGAANALLGKVHLFRKEYTEAKAAFDKVITSAEYSLTANYFDNFTIEGELNSESVFEILFDLAAAEGNAWGANWGGTDVGNVELTVRSREYGAFGGAWHNVNPTDVLVESYETADQRLKHNFYFAGDTYGASNLAVTQDLVGVEKASWKKYSTAYFLDTEGGLDEINRRVIRYADVLLMAAEVENELGNMAGAIELMNQVRDRVSMPQYGTATMNASYPVTSKEEVFAGIVHERKVEFAGEQIQFFDLIRWGMGATIPNFTANKNEIMPIPQKEIDTNIKLTNDDQNPGY